MVVNSFGEAGADGRPPVNLDGLLQLAAGQGSLGAVGRAGSSLELGGGSGSLLSLHHSLAQQQLLLQQQLLQQQQQAAKQHQVQTPMPPQVHPQGAGAQGQAPPPPPPAQVVQVPQAPPASQQHHLHFLQQQSMQQAMQQQQLMQLRELQQRRVLFDGAGGAQQLMPLGAGAAHSHFAGMGLGAAHFAGMGAGAAQFGGYGFGAGAAFGRFGGLGMHMPMPMPNDALVQMVDPRLAAHLKMQLLQTQQMLIAANAQLGDLAGGGLAGDATGLKKDKGMRGPFGVQGSFEQERTLKLKAKLAQMTQENLLEHHSRALGAASVGGGAVLHRRPGSPNRMTRGPRMSSSKYRGVSWHKRDKAWVARVWHNNKSEHVGVYMSEERAAIAVDMQLIQYKGVKDAEPLNFPDPVERERLLQMYCRSGDPERRSTTGGIKSSPPSHLKQSPPLPAALATSTSVPVPAPALAAANAGGAASADGATTTSSEAEPESASESDGDEEEGETAEPPRTFFSERRESEATESMTITPNSVKDELAAFAKTTAVPETNDEEVEDKHTGADARLGAAKRKTEAGDGDNAGKRTKANADISAS
jgi:hypothetical protein